MVESESYGNGFIYQTDNKKGKSIDKNAGQCPH